MHIELCLLGPGTHSFVPPPKFSGPCVLEAASCSLWAISEQSSAQSKGGTASNFTSLNCEHFWYISDAKNSIYLKNWPQPQGRKIWRLFNIWAHLNPQLPSWHSWLEPGLMLIFYPPVLGHCRLPFLDRTVGTAPTVPPVSSSPLESIVQKPRKGSNHPGIFWMVAFFAQQRKFSTSDWCFLPVQGPIIFTGIALFYSQFSTNQPQAPHCASNSPSPLFFHYHREQSSISILSL